MLTILVKFNNFFTVYYYGKVFAHMSTPVDQTNVIPFPTRPASPDSAPQVDPNQRLRHALETLEKALNHQRTAIADLRSGIGRLHTSMTQLQDNVGAYRNRLTNLKGQVIQANQQALKLADYAGLMGRLGNTGTPPEDHQS